MTLGIPRLYSAVVVQRVDGRELWDGARLREIREARNLSQVQVATAAGVGATEISRHETNDENSNPTIAVLARIAIKGLRVPLAALFDPVGSYIPRPEEEKRNEHADLLDKILATLDAESPAEDNWRGDVLKAGAALNRALRRSESQPPEMWDGSTERRTGTDRRVS